MRGNRRADRGLEAPEIAGAAAQQPVWAKAAGPPRDTGRPESPPSPQSALRLSSYNLEPELDQSKK